MTEMLLKLVLKMFRNRPAGELAVRERSVRASIGTRKPSRPLSAHATHRIGAPHGTRRGAHELQ